MKIIFAGTPVFAAIALDALHQADHEIALVLTQPDRPAGRGLQPLTSAVKRLAQERALPLSQPATLRADAIATEIAGLKPDAMIVAAYGLMIPEALLTVPALGCINIHASLLPRWRGAAPIQRAILAGDTETGITIMQMDEGLDTGPLILREPCAIEPDDTAQSLHDRLAALGGRLVVRVLDEPQAATPQDDGRATYAAKIDKREAVIDWNTPADSIERKVRAFNPAPGAVTAHEGTAIKIWRARVASRAEALPGTLVRITKDALTVACADGGALDVLELQRAGARRLSAAAFLAGSELKVGDRLGEA